MNLYESICAAAGHDPIEKIIRDFYTRAFSDGIIGHFFFGHDHNELVAKQTAFAIALLGGPPKYQGKPLAAAHRTLGIRNAHFGRRQVLMREVLEEHKIPNVFINEWLDREEKLRPLVISGANPPPCK
jgi:hemoglobin